MSKPTSSPFEKLKALYPGLSERQYEDLEAFYERYTEIIYRIYEQVSATPEAWQEFLKNTKKKDSVR